MNDTEIKLDISNVSDLKSQTLSLKCKYGDLLNPLLNPNDQIKWYFNKHRINNKNLKKRLNSNERHRNVNVEDQEHHEQHHLHNNHFRIAHNLSYDRNETISTLFIRDFSDRHNFGKYKCVYKGLVKTVKVLPLKNGKEFTRISALRFMKSNL